MQRCVWIKCNIISPEAAGMAAVEIDFLCEADEEEGVEGGFEDVDAI